MNSKALILSASEQIRLIIMGYSSVVDAGFGVPIGSVGQLVNNTLAATQHNAERNNAESGLHKEIPCRQLVEKEILF